MAKIKVSSILQAIGNTPVVPLSKVVPPHCSDIFVKLEYYSPWLFRLMRLPKRNFKP
jgi:cysteine synthase